MSIKPSARPLAVVALFALAVQAAAGAAVFPGVSLKIRIGSAPPDSISQVQVFVTEPKPISTGRGTLSTGFDAIGGIALASPAGDAAGVAVVDGQDVALTILSPSSTFGTDTDYPVLTIAGHVPAAAPIGTWLPFNLDPASLVLLDATGVAYPVEVKGGGLTVAPGVSIGDVRPGSADVPAGGVVSIFGTGFTPDTRIRLKGVALTATQYVSPTRFDVVLAAATRMQGVRVDAKNPDNSTATYYSYQRTTPEGSSVEPLLNRTVPVFSARGALDAVIPVPDAAGAVAIQNVEGAAATVVARLYRTDGVLLSEAALTVPAATYLVRSSTELFGIASGSPLIVRISSDVPVQSMAFGFDASGTTAPILPR